jgi:hypothetical protein
MSRRAILAATAIIVGSFNPVLMTPAMAAKPPINDTTGMTPQQVCDAQLTPSESSEFQTEPVNVSEGAWVVVDTVIGDPIGDPYGVGTPTFANVILSNSYFRNGQSPNVWAMAAATATYPNTGQMHETEIVEQRTVSFGCHVWKYVGPNDQNLVEPPGLQSTGNSTVEEETSPGDPLEVVTSDDFIVQDTPVNALICISPNNATKGKPGTWTGKNGFNAANCPAASTAAGGSVPSNNAPNI